jgi:hypothetical protein
MDFELSDELIAVRDLAREFAEKEIATSSKRWASWVSTAL